MDKVIVRIKGAGSLEVEGFSPSNVLEIIYAELTRALLETVGGSISSRGVRRIKRGPKKRPVVASSDSEVEGGD